ncbi:hypothetical protein TSOC_003790 [Tetrabaena socialis]|uniref:Uncharacterized protein n=1 Tax=Tetrabaena socialis TaxID=47790 RepID=A0A2J8AAQ7_9CHLO|nr:hypothetical protein TSOC_003790 [Tetrabaena socialis]|eukprot:PNH09553.1 hypothetical protein TSOC_003790 [Tetrabaena socialis]
MRGALATRVVLVVIGAVAVAHAQLLPFVSERGGGPLSVRSMGRCPPANFSAVPLDVMAYAAAPWYVQKQLPLNYQPVNELYCVRAEYTLRNPSNISAGLIANNYANRGGVNGAVQGSSKYDRNNATLLALPADTPDGSDGRLLVGPKELLDMFPRAWRSIFGPYWVVAVGPSKNATIKYDWAIISGGQPKYEAANGTCTTLPPNNRTAVDAALLAALNESAMRAPRITGRPLQPPAFDSGGLWFFSRKPVDPEATAAMTQRAQGSAVPPTDWLLTDVTAELGLDTSKLVPVQQEGCKYQA